jgi:hypothetical protein
MLTVIDKRVIEREIIAACKIWKTKAPTAVDVIMTEGDEMIMGVVHIRVILPVRVVAPLYIPAHVFTLLQEVRYYDFMWTLLSPYSEIL